MAHRIESGVDRGAVVSLSVDGAAVRAFAGETIATVLLAAGIEAFNRSAAGVPRGPFCNMGTCFECQVRMALPGTRDFRWVRACVWPVEEGMTVSTGARLAGEGVSGDGGPRDAD